MVSDLVLHCLPMSHDKDPRLIWVKLKRKQKTTVVKIQSNYQITSSSK